MSSDYLDLGSLKGVAEDLSAPIESDDFTFSQTTPPGSYTSLNRAIKGKRRDDGHYSFEILLEGGIINEQGQVFNRGQYPLKKTISTVPFKETNRTGEEIPGTTSSVARYLTAVGVSAKGLGIQDILDAMLSSQETPVRLYVSRTDRAVKNPITNQWENAGLKLQDFNAGSKDAPKWLEVVNKDGKEYKAKAVVTSFSRA